MQFSKITPSNVFSFFPIIKICFSCNSIQYILQSIHVASLSPEKLSIKTPEIWMEESFTNI